jgi:hypothetical protein
MHGIEEECAPLIPVPPGGATYVRSIAVKKVKPRGLFRPTKRETEKSDITPTPNPNPTVPQSNSPRSRGYTATRWQ